MELEARRGGARRGGRGRLVPPLSSKAEGPDPRLFFPNLDAICFPAILHMLLLVFVGLLRRIRRSRPLLLLKISLPDLYSWASIFYLLLDHQSRIRLACSLPVLSSVLPPHPTAVFFSFFFLI
ncbi:hypothetical protein VPH35_024501 [Triticum aestivum]